MKAQQVRLDVVCEGIKGHTWSGKHNINFKTKQILKNKVSRLREVREKHGEKEKGEEIDAVQAVQKILDFETLMKL